MTFAGTKHIATKHIETVGRFHCGQVCCGGTVGHVAAQEVVITAGSTLNIVKQNQ
jgi:hypothetical protein